MLSLTCLAWMGLLFDRTALSLASGITTMAVPGFALMPHMARVKDRMSL